MAEKDTPFEEMALDKVIIHYCEAIYIDDLYVYYKTYKFNHNGRPYNTLKLNINLQERKELDSYIRQFCNRSPKEFDSRLFLQQKQLNYRNYFVLKNTDDGIEVYKILDGMQLAYITNSNVANFEEPIIKYMTWKVKDERFAKMPKPLQKAEIREVLLADKLDEAKVIKKISNNPDEYCLCYINLDNIKEFPTPAWDNFMHQFECDEYKEIFMAWVYSIFVAENKGRQICWLYGKGKSGKSTVGKVLYKTLYAINPILSQTIERQIDMDKFTMASFENSRLIVIGDCMDKSLVFRQHIKNITGADIVAIRRMNSDKKSVEIHSKILATSNCDPYVNMDADHELTRLIYLRLDNAKCYEAQANWETNYRYQDWEKMLYQEVWGFIAKCKPYYEKWLSLDNHNFTQPERMLKDISEYCTYHSKRDTALFFKYNIHKEPGNRLLFNDIVDAMSKYHYKTNGNKLSRIRSFLWTYLKGQEQIEIKDVGIGNAKYIEGFALNEKQLTMQEIIDLMMNDLPPMEKNT